jgi:hypothetical protein
LWTAAAAAAAAASVGLDGTRIESLETKEGPRPSEKPTSELPVQLALKVCRQTLQCVGGLCNVPAMWVEVKTFSFRDKTSAESRS